MGRRSCLLGGLVLHAMLLLPAGAAAQGSTGDAPNAVASFLGARAGASADAEAGADAGTSASEAGAPGGEKDPAASPEADKDEKPPATAPPEKDPALDLVENPDESYFLLGIRSHAAFLPGFLINAFGLEEFQTVYGWALGPEFTYRRNAFDVVLSVWWAGYHVTTPSRESGDPDTETEVIKSTLGLVWFTVDFVSGAEIKPWVSFIYGGGFGLGITTGKVTRNEAYPVGDSYEACNGPGDPATGDYCDVTGGHYGDVEKKAKGVWPVYPTIQGRIGLRFKPIRNLVITPEFGIGLPELFTLGGRVNYMF